MPDLRTEYMPIHSLVGDDRNPKEHRLDLLEKSFDEFGFTEQVVIDERTGKLLSGHGRVEQLQARQLAGKRAPENIQTAEDGTWLVPVTRGVTTKDDAQAGAYLIAANRLTEVGGWDDDGLLDLLRAIEGQVDWGVVGYTDPEVENIALELGKMREKELADNQEGDLERAFAIVITCTDEAQQLVLIDRFLAEGLVCRALVS